MEKGWTELVEGDGQRPEGKLWTGDIRRSDVHECIFHSKQTGQKRIIRGIRVAVGVGEGVGQEERGENTGS
ncbi:hypothetical protein RRG08_033974 [Elysia crispata]|uniref:Uncharacterized protein n=1 Tax=Elysia crispata TaxID=231223 RepID=A0AAE0YSF5_9GAST|nr:hypothetical protein RRG08_033974 [Elysia crispata]